MLLTQRIVKKHDPMLLCLFVCLFFFFFKSTWTFIKHHKSILDPYEQHPKQGNSSERVVLWVTLLHGSKSTIEPRI
jgi:hypothetical protein